MATQHIPDDTNELENPAQSIVSIAFPWNYNQRWRIGFSHTLLDIQIAQVFLQTPL